MIHSSLWCSLPTVKLEYLCHPSVIWNQYIAMTINRMPTTTDTDSTILEMTSRLKSQCLVRLNIFKKSARIHQEVINAMAKHFGNTLVALTMISFIPAYIPCLEYVENPYIPVVLLLVIAAICFFHITLYVYMKFIIPRLISNFINAVEEAENLPLDCCDQKILDALTARSSFVVALSRPNIYMPAINRALDYLILLFGVVALIVITVLSDRSNFGVTEMSQLAFAWCIFFVNIFIRHILKDSLISSILAIKTKQEAIHKEVDALSGLSSASYGRPLPQQRSMPTIAGSHTSVSNTFLTTALLRRSNSCPALENHSV